MSKPTDAEIHSPPDPSPGINIVRPMPLTTPARYGFDSDQLALIKQTVARGADDNTVKLFLELVGRYRLDPWAGQVYLAKMPGKDGAPPTYTTIVSRDGLLTIANRHDDFEGMEGDVVYEGDLIERTADGFVHTYAAIPAEDRMKKGIVGAWARAYRDQRRPTFFFAKLSSYKRGNKVWSTYPDAMIAKCAQSMVLRLAYSITGLVPEDEIGAHYSDAAGGVIDSTAEMIDQEPDWGTDPELAERLQALFAEANELMPGSFLPQKVRLQLAGIDQAKRRQIAEATSRWIEQHGTR